MNTEMMTNYIYIDSPVGRLTLGAAGKSITLLCFGEQRLPGKYGTTDLLVVARLQLEEYFTGKRRSFELPLCFKGTEFSKRVWRALQDIPYGETASYGSVAAAVGCPGGARAVGGACNKNPIAIIIPCHRVVAANGTGGFAADVEIKKALLNFEKSIDKGII